MYIYPYVHKMDVCRISYICRIFVSVSLSWNLNVDICVLKKDVPEVDDITEVDYLLYAPGIKLKFIPSQKP